MSQEAFYFDSHQLSLRGWTRALRNRFLPKPDSEIRINHWLNYRQKLLYDVERVIFLEARADFVAAFAVSVALRCLRCCGVGWSCRNPCQPHPTQCP